jgi:hypothetical protein
VSGEFDLTSWEGRIEHQIGRGLTADEIVDAFDHIYAHAGEAPTRAGEWLAWGMLHGRRRILRLIEAITGDPSVASARARPSGAEWSAIVRAYQACRPDPSHPLPSQENVARYLGIAEPTLRGRLRKLNIKDWRSVHALVASED